MSKFKLTQTATEVQDILNNSLQKPTGLTKTKLVGVGVNGQENIEIGDNLTLANGKLSSATVNGLESDAEGNLTASKDLGVDGKLKLKSLVSASNPDGDITKELGGGGTPRHVYSIFVNQQFHYEVYTTKDYDFPIGKYNAVSDFITNSNYQELRVDGNSYPAGGATPSGSACFIPNKVHIDGTRDLFRLYGCDLYGGNAFTTSSWTISTAQYYIIKLF